KEKAAEKEKLKDRDRQRTETEYPSKVLLRRFSFKKSGIFHSFHIQNSAYILQRHYNFPDIL
ncbi:MAG: hypothetical protein IJA71_00025, partial [Clostridia bacterium]|nr:hypothetical protein [Clostridia bacterium]